MIPQNEGIPEELFSLTADTQRGFYALGMNPSFIQHYYFACLQALYNLSRLVQTANFFIFTSSRFVGWDAVHRARTTGRVRGIL
jgi:hypothetical protein